MNGLARTVLVLLTIAAMAIASLAHAEGGAGNEITLAPDVWKIVARESGPVNYYTVVKDGDTPHVHARYVPKNKTAVLGWQVPDADRRAAKKLRWSWRAVTLPQGGDECASGRGDSAAVVYVTWKRGLRYYTLKYVWSAVGTKGRTCDQKRNPFVAQDTIILESGGPVLTWKSEEIDLASEFRKHFEGGDPKAEIPDFVGIGLMTDGDQTVSESSADYGTFTVVR